MNQHHARTQARNTSDGGLTDLIAVRGLDLINETRGHLSWSHGLAPAPQPANGPALAPAEVPRRDDKPHPTGSIPLIDWQMVALDLAGFHNELGAGPEGPLVAEGTLVGARVAGVNGPRVSAMPRRAELSSLPEKK